MKKLLLVALMLFSCVSNAQQPNNGWNTSTVEDMTGPVGYIYQTYAIGTQYSVPIEKHPTSFRLICSVTNSSPIIAIFWDHNIGNDVILTMNIKIDRKDFQQNWTWIQDNNLIYRSLDQSSSLVASLKSSRIVSFEWIDKNGIKKVTMFNTSSFGKNLNTFNNNCGLE